MRTKEMFCNYRLLNNGCIVDSEGNTVKIFKSNKYFQCCLFDTNGNKHTMGLHTAVAILAVDGWYDGCVIHHKDGNQQNNHPSNLEIMSKQSHSKYHYEDGTYDKFKGFKPFGETNGNSKLTEEDVRYIKNNKMSSAASMAKKFNVSTTCILNILKGKTWINV